ncbi:hypothetical protein MPER_01173, partial [Moniliophthora perniciosa FA553]
SLGARSPKAFIDNLTLFLRGFCLGVALYPGQFWPHPFVILQGTHHIISEQSKYYTLILRTDSKKLLPPEWTILTLTQMMMRTSHWTATSTIQLGGDGESVSRLLADLGSRDDTLQLDPLIRWNGHWLKNLVEKRRRELGLPKGKYKYNWRTGWFALTSTPSRLIEQSPLD